uniref:Uncharacterized protein n=1 Tax=Stegastes partitus TaxID=144197 RepID=A0A3B5A948_9TELE
LQPGTKHCFTLRSVSSAHCADGWDLKMTNTVTPAATRQRAEVIPPPPLSAHAEEARRLTYRETRRPLA